MASATIVRLPRAAVPVFPDACCACGRDKPGDYVAYKARHDRWELFMPRLLFKRIAIAVPVCGGCRLRVVSGRLLRSLLLVTTLCLAFWFLYPWVESFGLGRSTTRVATVLVVLATLAPVLRLVTWWPPPFDLAEESDYVDYEFASPAYARRFAEANPGAVLER